MTFLSFRFSSATLMCAQVMAKIFMTYKEGIIAQAGRERRDLEACFSLRPTTFTFYQDTIFFFFFCHQNDSAIETDLKQLPNAKICL